LKMKKLGAKKWLFILLVVLSGLLVSVVALTASQEGSQASGIVQEQENSAAPVVGACLTGQISAPISDLAIEFSQKEQLKEAKKLTKEKGEEDFRALTAEEVTQSKKSK